MCQELLSKKWNAGPNFKCWDTWAAFSAWVSCWQQYNVMWWEAKLRIPRGSTLSLEIFCKLAGTFLPAFFLFSPVQLSSLNYPWFSVVQISPRAPLLHASPRAGSTSAGKASSLPQHSFVERLVSAQSREKDHVHSLIALNYKWSKRIINK